MHYDLCTRQDYNHLGECTFQSNANQATALADKMCTFSMMLENWSWIFSCLGSNDMGYYCLHFLNCCVCLINESQLHWPLDSRSRFLILTTFHSEITSYGWKVNIKDKIIIEICKTFEIIFSVPDKIKKSI